MQREQPIRLFPQLLAQLASMVDARVEEPPAHHAMAAVGDEAEPPPVPPPPPPQIFEGPKATVEQALVMDDMQLDYRPPCFVYCCYFCCSLSVVLLDCFFVLCLLCAQYVSMHVAAYRYMYA